MESLHATLSLDDVADALDALQAHDEALAEVRRTVGDPEFGRGTRP